MVRPNGRSKQRDLCPQLPSRVMAQTATLSVFSSKVDAPVIYAEKIRRQNLKYEPNFEKVVKLEKFRETM